MKKKKIASYESRFDEEMSEIRRFGGLGMEERRKRKGAAQGCLENVILSRIAQFLWRSSRLIRHHCLWRLSCSFFFIFCVLVNFYNVNSLILSEFLICISLVLLNIFRCFLCLNCVSECPFTSIGNCPNPSSVS